MRTFRNRQQPDLLQDRFDSWVVKRATSLLSSFCSSVAKQVACFFIQQMFITGYYHMTGTAPRAISLETHTRQVIGPENRVRSS